MRAIHLLRKYDPAEWGGTETAIRQLTSGLEAHGVESVVYAPRLETETPAGCASETGWTVRRFKAFMPVAGIPSERRRALVAIGGNLLSFDLAWQLAREPADVVHSHALGRLGAIACKVAHARGLPFVLSVHGGAYDLPASVQKGLERKEGLDWGKAFGVIVNARNFLDDVDAVCTCNPQEAKLMRERHPNLRIVVQPHGVPTRTFATDRRQAAREAFPQIAGRELFLMPGRIDPVKNQGWVVEQAAEIVRRHPAALIVAVGPCTNPPYGEEIRRKIEALGLGGHVILPGGLPPGDPRLIGLLQEARAVLLPSLSETFGLVILEAWAAGTPVISSRTSGAAAMVDEGRNGFLFDLNNPAAFQGAVDAVLADEGRRRSWGENGRAKAADGFDTGVLAGKMRQLYDELREKRGHASVRREAACTT